MLRVKRTAVAAFALVVSMMVTACGGGDTTESLPETPVGDPVAGGTARFLQVTEPRGLDPAALQNSISTNALVGNALYGTLLIDNGEGEIEPKMAESFTSKDNGLTFELKLRPGLRFSDNSPLDAAAVKFNWDRIKDPALGSQSIRDASLLASTEVVDVRTLKVTLTTPIPKYGHAVADGSLNWIASPAALRGGRQAYDARPVGAGPFTLVRWARQDRIEMTKNPGYWDRPKPYLDGLTIRTITDTTQRMNALRTGEADLAINTDPASVADARDQGLNVDTVPLDGGQAITLNTRRAPFDDVRARRALAAALDLDTINAAAFEGAGEVPRTLFSKSSPFYSDIPFPVQDKATAQRLFDELAADGKKFSFTFTAYSTAEANQVAQSVQAQLSAYRNVEVKITTIDLSEIAQVYARNNFDALISAALLVDPEPQLWNVFYSRSSANRSGIIDDRLDAALDAGRVGKTAAERKAAYDEVQRRLIDLMPVIFYTRPAYSVVASRNTHGVLQYGFGSPVPEEIWIAH